MFFDEAEFSAADIVALKIGRKPYRNASGDRPHCALSFRISGSAVYEFGGDTLTVHPGDILFVPAHVEYIKDNQQEQLYVIHFTCSKVLGTGLKRFTPRKADEYRQLFSRLLAVWNWKEPGYSHEIKQLFYTLVTRLERESQQLVDAPTDPRVLKIIDYIHENYIDPSLSVSRVAQHMHMSETYLRKLFLQALDITPKKYISDLRLRLAGELLGLGYYTVSEVAQRCGFTSVYYFSAFIKEQTGKSPRDFARQKNP